MGALDSAMRLTEFAKECSMKWVVASGSQASESTFDLFNQITNLHKEPRMTTSDGLILIRRKYKIEGNMLSSRKETVQ